MTFTQRLQTEGTAQERAVWNNAVKIEKRERVKLARQLTANIADEERRKTMFDKLMTKDLEDLMERVELMPPVTNRISSHLENDDDDDDFSGAGGGPVGNRRGNDDDDLLELPTVNYNELAYKPKKQLM